MKKSKKNIRPATQIKLLDNTAPFAVRESFNQLRTNLMYTITEADPCPVFGITSVSEDSGKSTIIVNLAISFSQIGKKVLLVDGDMRCPVVYRFFDLEPKHVGLSEAISGIENDVIIKDVMPGLDLITSGHLPPNPSELLTSNNMKALIAKWKSDYDIIFFDFPPTALLTDAVALCNDITGYIFDVRSGFNSASEVNATLENMERVGAKIVGIVLNDYNIKGSGRYARKSRYSHYETSRYAAAHEQAAETESK